MKKFRLLLLCALVGILVALTYYLFETAVHNSINFVWDTAFNSGNNRLLVIPLCIIIGLIFFGFQHLLAPGSDSKEAHSLGGEPIDPTIRNLSIILLLGYLSLLSGASLGPEAVLVPAATVIGGLVGVKFLKTNKKAANILVGAAIMALMTAFFHSIAIGILSVLLVTKQAKIKVSTDILIVAVVSSVSSFLVLNMIDPENRYLNLPTITWRVAIVDILVAFILVNTGYMTTFFLSISHTSFVMLRKKAQLTSWWRLASFATIGLSILYLMGGPLVQFTGNESIAPLIEQAGGLGMIGLIGILIIKIFVISWSKAMGYRGGLIFPMIFVASTLVAMAQVIFTDANFGIGLIAAMAGILLAEKKAKILL